MSPAEIFGKIILIPFFIVYILLLSKPRFSVRATVIIALIVVTFYTLMTYTIIWKFYHLVEEYPVLDILYRYGNMILMSAFSLLLTRQRPAHSIFVTGSVLVSISVVGVIAMAILLISGTPELPVRIAAHSIFGLFLFLIRKPFVEFLNGTKKGWKLLCSVPAFLIICFLFVTSVPVSLERNPSNMPAALVLGATTIFIYITLVFVMRVMYQDGQLEHNVMSLRIFVSSLEHQNNIVVQNAKRMTVFRHDLRHIAQMISACLDKGDTEGVRELLIKLDKNIGEDADKTVYREITGHNLADVVLSYYIASAKEIGVDIQVVMDSIDNLEADITEFAVVLSNALENAVNACKAMPESEERVIRVSGQKRGRQFFLEIANTCAGTVYFDPDTGLPASYGEGHGFGSQSITYFADKYGAALEFGQDGNWFHMRLLLNLAH